MYIFRDSVAAARLWYVEHMVSWTQIVNVIVKRDGQQNHSKPPMMYNIATCQQVKASNRLLIANVLF